MVEHERVLFFRCDLRIVRHIVIFLVGDKLTLIFVMSERCRRPQIICFGVFNSVDRKECLSFVFGLVKELWLVICSFYFRIMIYGIQFYLTGLYVSYQAGNITGHL